MTTSPPVGNTAYETWVRTLRAWAEDQSTPLNHLPQLADDTFTPETYRAFFGYLSAALDAVSKRWVKGLDRAWSTSDTPFVLARELIQLRAVLARRVQLARHPALPPAIRDILEKDLVSSVQRYQRELEDNVRKSTATSRLDAKERESLLTVVRENSFLKVLDYGVAFDGSVPSTGPLPLTGGTADSPGGTSAGPPGSPPAQAKRWAHRVIRPQ